MNRVSLFKLAASSLIIGGLATGCSADGQNRVASASSTAPQAKAAAQAAQQARKLLAKKQIDRAIAQAEIAVAAVPESADYRALLGQAYLASGRFQSAETSFADAVSLDQTNGRAALNLALAQIALAKSDAALATLEAGKGTIALADYGLALALAGDTENAVTALERAARAPDADAKARQNLALAYALANRWAEAKTVAAQDLAPELVDQRIREWATFARPQASWDQVSALLGVKAAWDPGQPARLALRDRAAPVQTAAADVAVGNAPVAMADAAPADQGAPAFEMPAPEPEPVPALVAASADAAPKPALAAAVFEEPVVKPTPAAALIRADAAPIKQAVVAVAKPVAANASPQRAPTATESGRFVVQLGAFSSQSRAEIAWKSASAKTRELGNFTMGTSKVQVKDAALYRLSVSGFVTREAAGQVCAKVKAAGGQCFIRSVSESAPMQWAGRGGSRIASRK